VYCIEDYQRHNVDVSHMVTDLQGETTLSVCIAEEQTKERSFIAKWGTDRLLGPEELDRNYICSAKYIHIGFVNSSTVQAAKWAKEAGVNVSIDAGYYYPTIQEHMHLFDIFIASEQYYRAIFNNENYKKNCRELQKQGPKTVIITLGTKGCVGWVEDEYVEVPAFRNIDVKDTTGAGDVFHGAFLYGLNQGWDGKKTAIFSSAVSAITCTGLGGRAAIPDLKAVQRFLEDGDIDLTEIDKNVTFYKNGIFDFGSRAKNGLNLCPSRKGIR
jgi:sugar/nucleoside kinase (ribokinase family)